MSPIHIGIFVVWLVSLVGMVSFVLMNAGKGGGFSDSASASLYASKQASAVMEQNLNRITNVFIFMFVASIIACMLFFPQGIVGY